MTLPACIGKPLPPQKGKIPASSKAAAAAAATAAAILHRLYPRKKISFIEKDIHQEERIWDCKFLMTDADFRGGGPGGWAQLEAPEMLLGTVWQRQL